MVTPSTKIRNSINSCPISVLPPLNSVYAFLYFTTVGTLGRGVNVGGHLEEPINGVILAGLNYMPLVMETEFGAFWLKVSVGFVNCTEHSEVGIFEKMDADI